MLHCNFSGKWLIICEKLSDFRESYDYRGKKFQPIPLFHFPSLLICQPLIDSLPFPFPFPIFLLPTFSLPHLPLTYLTFPSLPSPSLYSFLHTYLFPSPSLSSSYLPTFSLPYLPTYIPTFSLPYLPLTYLTLPSLPSLSHPYVL